MNQAQPVTQVPGKPIGMAPIYQMPETEVPTMHLNRPTGPTMPTLNSGGAAAMAWAALAGALVGGLVVWGLVHEVYGAVSINQMRRDVAAAEVTVEAAERAQVEAENNAALWAREAQHYQGQIDAIKEVIGCL